MPDPIVASAPARADFLNTHQDYKGLPVVAVALNLRTYLTAKPLESNTITIKSEELERYGERSIDSFKIGENEIREKGFFGNYLRAALNVIAERGGISKIHGLNITVSSEIPIGAGLASSAALTVAFVALLNGAFSLGYSRKDLAEIAYVAESLRVGTHCGRLDQYGASFGGVIKLECRPPYTVEQLPFTDLTFAVADSGIRHSTQDVHTKRQFEIDRGLKVLMENENTPVELKAKLGYHFDQPKWEELSEQELEDLLPILDDDARRRILFTLKMNMLTDIALKILRRQQISEKDLISGLGIQFWNRLKESAAENHADLILGQIMNAQHWLLRDLYDVSLPKIEGISSAALAAGAYGAKLSGAGMGGSIIALVKDAESGQRVINACLDAGAKNGWVSKVGGGAQFQSS